MVDPATTSPALTVRVAAREVTVDQRPFQVLGRIEIQVERDEIVAIVGSSGSGKTTLLRLMAGLDTAFDGEIRSFGTTIHGPGRDRGVVFQEHRLMPWMTVADNVAYALPSERPDDESAARVAAALELVGLSGFAGAWPNQLSGGMAQRASLARALAAEPRILLMDEPLGALDSLLRTQMQTELERIIRDQALSAVVITHDVDEAILLADRVLVMAGTPGHIVDEVHIPLTRPRHALDDDVQTLRATILGRLYCERT